MSTAVTGELGPVAPKALEKDDGGLLREADRCSSDQSCSTNVEFVEFDSQRSKDGMSPPHSSPSII